MTRPSFRFPFAEFLSVLGIIFGAWLIHQAFQPTIDTPNLVVLWLGGLDIMLFFALLGYQLRERLREGESLPRDWIIWSVVGAACFLGWIAALLIDAERLRNESQHLRDSEQQLVALEESIRQFSQVLPMTNAPAERNAWEVNHNRYARQHDQLVVALKSKPDWNKELTKIDEQVQQMQKLFGLMFTDADFTQRIKDRSDYLQTSGHAVQYADALRLEVIQGERDVATTYRARWQALASSALFAVFFSLGCMGLWLVFDRELRHRGKVQKRLTAAEAHYRSLVEHQPDPVAVLDPAMNIQYVNPAWQTKFNYRPEELPGRNLFELIHADDLPRVRTALQTYDVLGTTKCRLSADYGVWHDVEMQCQEHDDEKTAVVRFHDVRESAQAAMELPRVLKMPEPAPVPNVAQKALEERLAETERQLQSMRNSEQQARNDLHHHRWLLGTHKDASTEGLLILSAQGQVLSWNPAFVQMWKLSNETMSGHTWMTIAAHMETLARAGWDDFQRAAKPQTGGYTDACWEMNLEGGRKLEVYAQALHDQPQGNGAVQFHFRDVTKNKELESQLRDHEEQQQHWHKTLGEHEEQKKSYEVTLRDREKQLKHLEKKLRDHENRFKDLEATLRDKDDHHQNLQNQLSERDRHRAELEAAVREKDDHHKHLQNQLSERDRHRAELEATLQDHQERLQDLHQSHQRHADNLQAGKESMRRLANGIASEFNKILSVVLGNADVLHESLPKDHLAQSCVDEIKQAASHGAEMSQRLLAFGRNHLLQMVPVDVNRQLSAFDPKIRETLGQNVEVKWAYANHELWVKTDPHPLEQALMHVLAHAHQHMPKGGMMTIQTSSVELSKRELTHADMTPGPYIELRLQDTGDGMDDETVAHVFEPYHPTREGQKGDLTLATAYGIIRQSGGCIEVESTKGQGTTWTILLPATDERPQAIRASA